jgi:hypothetical protein
MFLHVNQDSITRNNFKKLVLNKKDFKSLNMMWQNEVYSIIHAMNDGNTSLWEKGCFATNLATQFLSCIEHCECYQTNNNSYKSYNSPYIRCNSL